MNTDDFQKKLQRQSFRKIPGDWRENILHTAQHCISSTCEAQQPLPIRAVLTIWRELLRPCWHAWSSMAALWVIFWILNINASPQLRRTPTRMTASTSSGSERIRLFNEQRRVLVELTGPVESSAAAASRRTQ